AARSPSAQSTSPCSKPPRSNPGPGSWSWRHRSRMWPTAASTCSSPSRQKRNPTPTCASSPMSEQATPSTFVPATKSVCTRGSSTSSTSTEACDSPAPAGTTRVVGRSKPGRNLSMSPSISRRRALQLGAAASAFGAVGLTSCSSGGSGEERSNRIVVSTFPFGVEEFTKAVIDPFTEATGIEVELSTGSNADRLSRLRLENGEDGTDVTLMSDTYAAMADQDGLFQEVTAEKGAALNDIAEFAVDKAYTGPAYSYQLNGALYRKDKLDAAEATAWDLYANSQYSGKIALPDIAVTAGLLTVAGVGSAYGEDPYDIDTEIGRASWRE